MLVIAVALIGTIATVALVIAILGYPDDRSSPSEQPGTTSDACASSPCGQESTCVPIGAVRFTCQCGRNYFGERCDQVVKQGKKQYTIEQERHSPYTQKNVTLHQVDISMSNCWISWQLFP